MMSVKLNTMFSDMHRIEDVAFKRAFYRKMMIESEAVHCNLCCCLLDFVGDFVSVHLVTILYSDIIYSPCV